MSLVAYSENIQVYSDEGGDSLFGAVFAGENERDVLVVRLGGVEKGMVDSTQSANECRELQAL
jgi:hypothetical protein